MSDIIAFVNKYKLNDITTREFILHIENVSLFIISILSFASFLYYNSRGDDLEVNYRWSFDTLSNIAGTHAFIDLFLTNSTELKLHHIFMLYMIFFNYYYQVSSDYNYTLEYSFLKTEMSSFFYVLKYWLPNNSFISHVNSFLFFISFFKLRILDLYNDIIQNPLLFKVIFEKYTPTNYFANLLFLISIYGLYLFNVYWFMIMCKILYKAILKSSRINTDIMCHYLCSYIYWFNIPLAIYIYSFHPNEKYILDMIGVVGLSITSYLYHYDIYNKLINKKIDEYKKPDKENMVIFINDNIFIQLRSFLTNITSYLHSPYFMFICCLSGFFHLLSMYNIVLNILELFINHDDIKDNFINIHNVFTSIPIGLDVSLIAMNSTNEIAISFIFVNILMAMMLVVEPFYKLSHFAFHILLIAQTYYLCLSHSSNV